MGRHIPERLKNHPLYRKRTNIVDVSNKVEEEDIAVSESVEQSAEETLSEQEETVVEGLSVNETEVATSETGDKDTETSDGSAEEESSEETEATEEVRNHVYTEEALQSYKRAELLEMIPEEALKSLENTKKATLIKYILENQ